MSEQIKIAIMSFGHGMATFVRPWRFANSAPVESPAPRGIGRHFAVVGRRLTRAVEQFAEQHQEIPAYAH